MCWSIWRPNSYRQRLSQREGSSYQPIFLTVGCRIVTLIIATRWVCSTTRAIPFPVFNIWCESKPGGIVVVSLYNTYSRRVLRMKQTLCKSLGGDNIDKRVEWAEKLFRGTLRKLDKRYHGQNTKAIAYDIFGFPHESLHSAAEVLGWFDRTNVEYKAAFAPLRLQDYFYAFAQPEYAVFRSTFAGFPLMRLVADAMFRTAGLVAGDAKTVRQFPRPSRFETHLVQSMWIPFGLRFNCFTISGIKR